MNINQKTEVIIPKLFKRARSKTQNSKTKPCTETKRPNRPKSPKPAFFVLVFSLVPAVSFYSFRHSQGSRWFRFGRFDAFPRFGRFVLLFWVLVHATQQIFEDVCVHL